MNNKLINVVFCEKRLEILFNKLKDGKFQDRKLYEFINRAKDDIKKDPACAVKVPKKLWPKSYTQKYNITNLWKYDLPNAWRLTYTIKENEIIILGVILEWMNHKEYERKFKY